MKTLIGINHMVKNAVLRPLSLAIWLILVSLMGTASSQTLLAQDSFGDADLFPNFSLGGFGENDAQEPVEWSAQYFADSDGKARLEIEANLAETWHLYSTTQPPGGPTRTEFKLLGPDAAKITGAFKPDQSPSKSVSSLYNGLTVEEHEGTVVWSVDLQLASGFKGPIQVQARGLVCKSGGSNRCMPVQETLTAKLAGTLDGTSAAQPASASQPALVSQPGKSDAVADAEVSEPFRDGKYVVEWRAVVTPKQLGPGDKGVLRFTAKPDSTYHVYKAVTDDSESSTNFVLTDKAGLLVGAPVANQQPVTKTLLPSLPPISYYKGAVTWELPFQVPADASDGVKTLTGLIAYQACTDSSCQRPQGLKFSVQLQIGQPTQAQPAGIKLVTAKSADVLDAAAETDWVDEVTVDEVASQLPSAPAPPLPLNSQGASDTDLATDTELIPDSELAAGTAIATDADASASTEIPFWLTLCFAFLGGLILNVMPCVLPVVGLKILGFVNQAGEDRRRIMVLNLVYMLGIMSVFFVLGSVAGVSKFGWGQQFTLFPFRLGMTLALFALALSYLDVWEIPVPGMAAGKTSQDLQSREGVMGAFSKGVFATILATPCSGPLLGYILGLTLQFSPATTVLVFLTVGFGMAFPYLVIGARPSLVSWLPKPGPWMDTLKQLMAFLFLGTVAWFFAQFDDSQKLSVFISLGAVWFGCWIIGQVPNWAELQKRLLAWAGGITVATLISMWAFSESGLQESPELKWVDYSETRLQELQGEGRTVMLDFGAKWCGTCIYNYETAIDTDETRMLVEELDAIAMYADWTDYSEEIKQKLEELQSRSIPLLAIYPGNRPGEPIILRDIVTQQNVSDALREAGASVNASQSKSRSSIASTIP
jgi:thiol:disulfide interchange protein